MFKITFLTAFVNNNTLNISNNGKGPDLEGCNCEDTEFKCCPDDVTAATGPDFAGCGCYATEHKCCPDKFTPAEGPNFFGCPCHTHEYGCCPDGKSIARGPGQVQQTLNQRHKKIYFYLISLKIKGDRLLS